jgi:hypothetical protein
VTRGGRAHSTFARNAPKTGDKSVDSGKSTATHATSTSSSGSSQHHAAVQRSKTTPHLTTSTTMQSIGKSSELRRQQTTFQIASGDSDINRRFPRKERSKKNKHRK